MELGLGLGAEFSRIRVGVWALELVALNCRVSCASLCPRLGLIWVPML